MPPAPVPTRAPRRRWAVLFAGLVATLAAWSQPSNALAVGTRTNVPPYEFLDDRGGLDGFCVEVLSAVARHQALNLAFQPMSNQEVWEAFDQRRVAIVSGAVHTEERTRTMDFSVPLATLPYGLLVRKGGPGIRSEQDLLGKEVLVLQRSHMASYAAARGLRTRGLVSYEACLRALAAGEGTAALVPRFTWLHLARQGGFGGLQEVPAEIYPHRVCFAVQKGDAALLARLNEGIFALKGSGELDRIHDRHLGRLERSQLPLRTALQKLAWFLVPAFLVTGFLVHLAWTFALRRLVKRRTQALQAELARRVEAEGELERTVSQLRHALAEVKQLSGLLPICAGCKKIRDEGGVWQVLEGYISAKSEATFSHGMCPDCMEAYFPEVPRTRRASPP